MPIKVNFLDNGVGVEIIASGVVTGEDIIEAHGEIYNIEYLHKQKYHIIDRSHCEEYKVTSEDVKKIVEIDKAAAKINPKIIVALVSPTDLQFGMSRIWQAYVEDDLFKTEIFRNRKSADDWIRESLNK